MEFFVELYYFAKHLEIGKLKDKKYRINFKFKNFGNLSFVIYEVT